MWVERGFRLIVTLALWGLIAGLLALSLPDAQAGPNWITWDSVLQLQMIDCLGISIMLLSVFSIWGTVLSWQRKFI